MNKTTENDIASFDKIYRANFGNSLSGYKCAALIATRAEDGTENVAVFNSIVHIGSNPPMLGYIQRPITVPRDTYHHLKATGYYSINHIPLDMAGKAHHTSASYSEGVSEFEKAGLTAEYKDGFHAPFVKGCPMQLAMKFKNEYVISENGTILVIGEVEQVYYLEEMLHDDGFLQLDKGDICAINSLDGYAFAKAKNRYAYARPDQPTKTLPLK